MKRRVVLALLLLSTRAIAAEPIFLQPSQLDARAILPQPPAAGSASLNADFAELHRIEASRTPAEIARAQYDENNATVFLFVDAIGPRFNKAEMPLTEALFMRVRNDENIFGAQAKEAWPRPRPFEADATLHPACRTTDLGTSYPGGHMLRAALYTVLLSEALPEKKDQIAARGADFAHNRLVCGSHYPSDQPGSVAFGTKMGALLLASPKFRAEFEPARDEMRRMLGLKPR
jgi:acid phosphatase (class A)